VHLQPDGGEQLGRLQLVAVGSGDDHDLALGWDDLGDLGGKAGVVGRGADRAGDVRLVELLVGARVDRAGARGDRRLEAARGQPRRRGDRLDQRPAVECDDVLDVGRPLADAPHRVLDELGLVGDRQRPVVTPLEADRRGGLQVDARAAAQRAAQVARPDLDLVGQGEQALVQRAEDPGGALARLDRQVRAGDVADEERVAAEDRNGVAAAAGIAQQEGGVLGPVPRRVDRLDRHRLAQLDGRAVAEGLVLVFGAGQLADVDRRPGGAGEAAVAGDVVGVVVRLQHVLDPHPVQAGEVEVGIDVPLRVDHRRGPRVRVADQVGGATEVLVDDLAEEHRVSGLLRIFEGVPFRSD
jgi:hypothetical protein